MLYIPEPNLCFFTIYTFSNLGDFAILWFSMCRLHNLTVFRWCNSAIRRFGKCMAWQFADVVVLWFYIIAIFICSAFVNLLSCGLQIFLSSRPCNFAKSRFLRSMFLLLQCSWDFLKLHYSDLASCFFNYAILRFSDYSIWDCKRGD